MNDFGRLLEKEIPRLRRYARGLTHDLSRADDLVQDTLVRAIAKQDFWQQGTSLRAWLFTLMHNQNVNGIRPSVRERRAVEFDDKWPSPQRQPIRQGGCRCAISIALSLARPGSCGRDDQARRREPPGGTRASRR